MFVLLKEALSLLFIVGGLVRDRFKKVDLDIIGVQPQNCPQAE